MVSDRRGATLFPSGSSILFRYPSWLGLEIDRTILKSHFEKPEMFKGFDFRHWQQKMLFYLTSLHVSYVFTNSEPTYSYLVDGESVPTEAQVWRFYNEPNALWVSVIKSIHGDEGGLTNFEAMKVKTGLWFHIARLKEDFLRLNINIDSIFKKSVRNGELTSFWNDRWIGNSTLKIAFGRLYALETDKSCSVSSRCPSFDHTSGLVYRCHWRRPPHGGPESTQLTELEELTTHLRVTDGSDF
ncbi:hypothetical protein Tco_0122788 [Tanacetum coccineum]